MNLLHPITAHNQHTRFHPSHLFISKLVKRQLQLVSLGSFFALVFLFLLPSFALARPLHAEYVSSDPAANAMLQKAPTTITIHFMEQVVPQGSDIIVYDVDGKQVSAGPAQVNPTDLKAMHVAIQPNTSEVYVVYWHNISAVEGHHDSGSFRFFVNISPMLKGMLANGSNGSQSSMAGMSTSGTSTSNASSDVPSWLATVIGIVGLVVGGGATYVAIRQSGQKATPKPNS